MKKANPRKTKRGTTVTCPHCGERTLLGTRCEKCRKILPPLNWLTKSWAEAKQTPTTKRGGTPTNKPLVPDPEGAENLRPKKGLAGALLSKQESLKDTAPHLIIEARAGTGKTTTLIEGLKRMKGLDSRLVPSPQQAKVWEAMERSGEAAKTICFVAFNKSIAEELKQRVPQGCEAMTMHGMGYKAVNRAFTLSGPPNSYRVQDIISELLETDIREIRKYKPTVIKATEELVGLCKMNLVGFNGPTLASSGNNGYSWEEELSNLASYYDVDLNGSAEEVFRLVPRVLERCKNVAQDGCIDFNDMIWLPVVLGLPLFQYDVLLVDEAQDLNRCQQALAKKAGRRLILCGDPKQAIYGFAGADSQSMSRMEAELEATQRGVEHLSLTVTRRCGMAIVAEAKKIVTDFDAFDSNPAGKISSAPYPTDPTGSERPKPHYTDLVSDGDMVLCRVNAPLVSQCFRFLKAGRKATIQGRDVGQGLINTVKKLGASGVEQLISKLDDWLRAEQKKENAKRNPNENKLIALQDRRDCILAFCEDQTTIDGVIQKIEHVFTDDKSSVGIRLSSIHKAKGLEAKRVFLLKPKGAECPHPMAKTAWQKEQERHLLYVAITRAIEELVYVS